MGTEVDISLTTTKPSCLAEKAHNCAILEREDSWEEALALRVAWDSLAQEPEDMLHPHRARAAGNMSVQPDSSTVTTSNGKSARGVQPATL